MNLITPVNFPSSITSGGIDKIKVMKMKVIYFLIWYHYRSTMNNNHTIINGWWVNKRNYFYGNIEVKKINLIEVQHKKERVDIQRPAVSLNLSKTWYKDNIPIAFTGWLKFDFNLQNFHYIWIILVQYEYK